LAAQEHLDCFSEAIFKGGVGGTRAQYTSTDSGDLCACDATQRMPHFSAGKAAVFFILKAWLEADQGFVLVIKASFFFLLKVENIVQLLRCSV
jgi:hypothetical protein